MNKHLVTLLLGVVFCVISYGTLAGENYNYVWLQKSQTVSGIAYDLSDEELKGFQGTVTMKLKAYNVSKMTAKASVTFTPTVGKKQSASTTLYSYQGQLKGRLTFKEVVGNMEVLVWYDDEDDVIRFTCTDEKTDYVFEAAPVGGLIDKESFMFRIGEEAEDVLLKFAPDGYDVIWEALPMENLVTVSQGKKLSAGKAVSLAYKKYKDEEGDPYYKLNWQEEEGDWNYSGLKFSYNTKSGALNGSFNVLMTNAESIGEGKKPSLKKKKVSFNGYYVADGWGAAKVSVKISGKTFAFPVYMTAD